MAEQACLLDENEDAITRTKSGRELRRISQPVPSDAFTGLVLQVVASTITDIVLDDSSNVLLLLYAPWCSHCTVMLPLWQQLGQLRSCHRAQAPGSTGKKIIVAQCDCTLNTVPDPFHVHSFPSIYFKAAGRAEVPVRYSDLIELHRILDFLDCNCR